MQTTELQKLLIKNMSKKVWLEYEQVLSRVEEEQCTISEIMLWILWEAV